MGVLHAACRDGKEQAAHDLVLRKGANVNELDGLKYSPLHYAARRGIESVVVLLLQAKANVGPLNNKGQSALYQAVVGGHTAAARHLIEHGADVNVAASSGFAPLHFAARQGPEDLVHLLVEAGAAIDLPTANGMKPCDLARQADRHSVEAYLLKAAGKNEPTKAASIVREKRRPTMREIAQAVEEGEIDEEAALMADLEAIEFKPSDDGPAIKPTLNVAQEEKLSSVRKSRRKSRGEDDDFELPATGPTPQVNSSTFASKPRSKRGNKLAEELLMTKPSEKSLSNSETKRKTSASPSASASLNGGSQQSVRPAPAATAASTPTSPTSRIPLEVKESSQVPKPQPTVREPQSKATAKKKVVLGPRMRPPSDASISPAEPVDYDNNEYSPAPEYNTTEEIRKTKRKQRKTSVKTKETEQDLQKFLRGLGLYDKCSELADEAGVVVPEDFLLFEQEELVNTFKFKVGHVRKIFKKLKK
eukprot:m.136422 g.136422  ORF g.136422 m.136422 type:complete len:476 (-) comp14733_c0_seq2:3510-4937(-)